MLSPADIERLAMAYETAPDSTHDPIVQDMIRAERARIDAAFAQLPINIAFVDHDPYRSFEHMREQIRSTGTMYVYKGGSDTPLWDPQTNWKARAVHDYDHLQKVCDFSLEGEAAAFRSSAAQCNALAPLYMSEILLQAVVANARGTFAQQKLVLVSPEITKWASHLRGLRGLTAGSRGESIAALVWIAAGIMRVDTPEAAVVHLRAMGLNFVTVAVVIDAAAQLNQTVDAGGSYLAGAPLRGAKPKRMTQAEIEAASDELESIGRDNAWESIPPRAGVNRDELPEFVHITLETAQLVLDDPQLRRQHFGEREGDDPGLVKAMAMLRARYGRR